MSEPFSGRQGIAGELHFGERMLAGEECVVRWPTSGEAAVVGGDDFFGCHPPARDPYPEENVSSGERVARRKTDCAG